MKYQGFLYTFTPRELAFFLFHRKKTCPRCGHLLAKQKSFYSANGEELNSSADDFFIPQTKVKVFSYLYTCPICKKTYTLGDLVSQLRR